MRTGAVLGLMQRAVLLLLAAVAMFALALLPGHGATATQTPHSADPTHAIESHLDSQVHGAFDPADGAPQAAHALEMAHSPNQHGDVPMCHSAQTSENLICLHSSPLSLMQLLAALIAAISSIAGVVILAAASRRFAHLHSRLLQWPAHRPIRTEHGLRLLTLDCVARI